MTGSLAEALRGIPPRVKTAVALGAIVAISLANVAGLLHSVGELLISLDQVRSIYVVDIQALGVDGELQYQIQESRIKFLEVLSPGAGADRLDDVRRVRDADLEVSLLAGRAAVLTSGPGPLRPFVEAWNRYDDIKDDMIALALQGRFADALAMETTHGNAAFDAASEAIRRAKQQQNLSSASKVEVVWEALRRACIEVLALLAATVAFIMALLAGEAKRKRILRSLLSTTRTLRESETRFRGIFEEAAVGIVSMDLAGAIVSANRAVEEITGYPEHELTGKTTQLIMSDRDRQESAESIGKVARGEVNTYRAERQIVRKDGGEACIRISVSLARKDGEPANVIALWEDISEQKRAEGQLRHQATHDALTDLPNRRWFEEALKRAVDGAVSGGSAVSLLYLDLDGFKLVNDTLGHGAGDSLLAQVGRRLARCMGPVEVLARIGGDEFTVIQPVCGPLPTANAGDNVPARVEAVLAQNLLNALNRPFVVNGQEIRIGASIGISRYPGDGLDGGDLLQSADAAMYYAKRDKQGYHFFNAQMHYAVHRRLKVENQLRGAIERHELSVEFQPLYDLSSEKLIRFEALCRWHNAELGQVLPLEFIPVAEETGLIAAIGRYVLVRACEEALRWQEIDRPPIIVAVNVSASQFHRHHFVEEVGEVLRETSLPASLLEIEITESALIGDMDESVDKMRRFREMGIGISIDDFGTGYSSLSYLQNMPVGALKIDQSFTTRLERDASAAPMVRSIIAMGHALGLRVVSEGIENKQQLKLLQQLGTDEVQGYYFGRPESAGKALERVLRERPSEASTDVWNGLDHTVSVYGTVY
jgi:diguanylate cyclase (GGDEF)-like protein/PAS domain S-box-containing protein